jgi:hypothetical protein
MGGRVRVGDRSGGGGGRGLGFGVLREEKRRETGEDGGGKWGIAAGRGVVSGGSSGRKLRPARGRLGILVSSDALSKDRSVTGESRFGQI